MDTQLKRGLLDICVLKSLVKEQSYGYQIIKDISNYVAISESTLYPILKRLELANLVKVHCVEHSGRLRKYYCITIDGRDKITAFLREWKEISKIYEFISQGY